MAKQNKQNNDWKIIFNQFKSLYLSSFTWQNLPLTVNQRFIEQSLFDDGKITYFNDEVIGNLALKGSASGPLDVYYEPTTIRVIGGNGYTRVVKNHEDACIIWDNASRYTPKVKLISLAQRIALIEKTIDINIYAQRTPLLLKTSKKLEYTVKNLLQQYDRLEYSIVVDKELMDNPIEVITTQAPYVADKLEEERRKLWNEALSYIGIENNFSEKNERLVSNEVLVSNGLAIAQKNDRVNSRQIAIDEINRIFGTDIFLEVNNISVLDFYSNDIGGVGDGEV